MRRGALTVWAAVILTASAPAPNAEAGQWLAGDLHVHTPYSHDSYGGPGDDNTGIEEAYTLGVPVAEQFRLAASRGHDFLAITDHNDVRSQSDPGFGAGGVIGIPGYEASLQGHAQMLGARSVYDAGGASAAEVEAIAATLRAPPDAGVFQINHPAEGSTRFPDDIDWGYAYEVVPDTVEVWNVSRLWQPPLPSASSNDDAIAYWQGWLDRGERVAATGGSDSHWLATVAVQGPGQPTTWVHAETPDAAGVLAGLRAGRTFISHLPPRLGGPRIFLEADGDGDGGFESMVGDAVPPGSQLRVRVVGAAGASLRIVTDGGREAFAPVTVSGNRFDHGFELPADATWARAEVFLPDLEPERVALCDGVLGADTTYCRNQLLVLAMSSAIYLR
ncbi:MAG: CehA/McbA family metallohydrolase [Solirubrobacterales bacterium]